MNKITKVLIWFNIGMLLHIFSDETAVNYTKDNFIILFISLVLLWFFYNLQDKEFKNKVIKILTKF